MSFEEAFDFFIQGSAIPASILNHSFQMGSSGGGAKMVIGIFLTG
jgi:hypothetical protein